MRSDERWSRSADDFLPSLAGYGREVLLSTKGISLCGSRAAGDTGLEFARTVGSFAAEYGLSLVSGYAKGVDLAGHIACVKSGGNTIAVLAEGVGQFRLRRELQGLDEIEHRLTVVSEFEDNARWTVWRAMQRNTTICELGHVLVAVDPGEKGGTLDAVKKAVKREMPVVIAWSDADADPDHLTKLDQSGVSFVDSGPKLLEELRDALYRQDGAKPPEQLQMTLPLTSD